MVSWLKLRMERYTHQQETLNSRPEIMVLDDDKNIPHVNTKLLNQKLHLNQI